MAQALTVVTGGGRGIGTAVCSRLAAAGHDLVIAYRTDVAAAEKTAQAARAIGRRALIVQADVTRESEVAALFEQAASLGAVSGLVNSAGAVRAVGPLVDLDVNDIRDDIEVNLLGTIICCQAAARVMGSAGGGAIVNLSSAAATLGSPGVYVHYAAAKAGIDAFTLGLSKELAPLGIRVNAVAPGVIWTDFHLDPERPAKLADSIPLGRSGQPEEVASAVTWLLSDEASYTTGAVLRVAGGR